jgi:hypothetical protein
MRHSTGRILTTHAGSLPRQRAARGIDRVNDGEASKSNFTWYAVTRLGGLEVRPPAPGPGLPVAEISGRDRTALVEGARLASNELWQGAR